MCRGRFVVPVGFLALALALALALSTPTPPPPLPSPTQLAQSYPYGGADDYSGSLGLDRSLSTDRAAGVSRVEDPASERPNPSYLV